MRHRQPARFTGIVWVFKQESKETDRNLTQNTQELPVISTRILVKYNYRSSFLLALSYILLLIQSEGDKVWLDSLKHQRSVQCLEWIRYYLLNTHTHTHKVKVLFSSLLCDCQKSSPVGPPGKSDV